MFVTGLLSLRCGSRGLPASWSAGADPEVPPALCSSEVRLLEIVEGLCEASDFECNRLLEEQEELLEAWWLRL